MKRWFILMSGVLHVIFAYAITEKPMVIVIPSYNNEQWYERNLDSACFQNYEHYRIIYIDDCSSDGTGDLVRDYIDKHNLHDKVTLVRNETNRGALYNLYAAIHGCADDTIIVTLDGDDWLAHDNVLKRVNEEYQDPNVWMTYGQFESYPNKTVGFCRDIENVVVRAHAYREVDWVTSHLRTFYAGLFKRIKLKDLVYEGELFRVTWDMAFLFPLLEMAHGKFRFIPDVLYIYNEDTPLNDFKLRVLKQLRCNKIIHGKEKYSSVSSYISSNRDHDSIDMVIFSSDADDLYMLLETVQARQLSITTITVLIDKAVDHQYDKVKRDFTYVDYVCYQDSDSLTQALSAICADPGYMLLATDYMNIKALLPLQEALAELKRTQALSCNFSLGADVERSSCLHRTLKKPSFTETPSGFLAWEFADEEFEWREPYACSMVLCKKSDVGSLLADARFESLDEMQSLLRRSSVDLHQMGLCPKTALVDNKKNISIPEFLLPLLSLGYKVCPSRSFLVKI